MESLSRWRWQALLPARAAELTPSWHTPQTLDLLLTKPHAGSWQPARTYHLSGGGPVGASHKDQHPQHWSASQSLETPDPHRLGMRPPTLAAWWKN